MATYRIGIGSFSLAENGGVGIGTDSAGLGNLRVEGTFKTTDLDTTTGIATFTRYAGFAADNIGISSDIVVSGEHQTRGDIVVGLNSTFTVSTGATVAVGAVESVSIGTHFSPPTGGVEERPEKPVEGTVRFNKDLNTLEFYNGVDWRQFTVSGASGRAIICGGTYPYADITTNIDAVSIPNGGSAYDFGELMTALRQTSCCGSKIRGLTWGGQGSPSQVDEISYFNTASKSKAVDFGNMDGAGNTAQALSSSTRGISYGRGEPANNRIDYVEIPTLGNASDFGDCYAATRAGDAFASPTRGVLAGGTHPNATGRVKKIEYITIASKGNGTFFGDLTLGRRGVTACSNTTRGIVGGGYLGDASPYPRVDTIDSITIASTGNATDFGDLIATITDSAASASETRAVFAGGDNNPVNVDTVQYIEFASKGNAVNFGEMNGVMKQAGATSDCHGGLGGY